MVARRMFSFRHTATAEDEEVRPACVFHIALTTYRLGLIQTDQGTNRDPLNKAYQLRYLSKHYLPLCKPKGKSLSVLFLSYQLLTVVQ